MVDEGLLIANHPTILLPLSNGFQYSGKKTPNFAV